MRTRTEVICIDCQKTKKGWYSEFGLVLCDKCHHNLVTYKRESTRQLHIDKLKRRERYWKAMGVTRWLRIYGLDLEEYAKLSGKKLLESFQDWVKLLLNSKMIRSAQALLKGTKQGKLI